MSGSRAKRTFPLGIDVGETSIRVALTQQQSDGTPDLIAVATRARAGSGDLASTIADAVDELKTHEKRCVFAAAAPAAILRSLRFPLMRRTELERAARFEASRLIDYPIDEAHVSVHPLRAGETAVGVIRKAGMADLRSLAAGAKLRLTAIDNHSFGLRRALLQTDAILDIGTNASHLSIYSEGVPRMQRIAIGGHDFTQAIARALGTDTATAERRKLGHGIAGGGEDVRGRLTDAVANALIDCRSSGYHDVRRLTIVGNSARISGLDRTIQEATAVDVHVASLSATVSSTLPPDVLRAAAPDWCLAYGLALWAAA